MHSAETAQQKQWHRESARHAVQLSGTCLQTAMTGDATKGALDFRASVHRRRQRPPKGLGASKTVVAA